MRRAATFLLIALAGCAEEPRVLSLELRLPQALGCRPTAIDEIEVRALGDFPAREPNVLVLAPSEEVRSIERFPEDTRLVTVEARGAFEEVAWAGGGVVPVFDGEAIVPILRYGRACAVADTGARTPSGAMVLALPDGRVWIAGGDSASISTLRPGEEVAQPSALRLFAPRTHASASWIGDGLVLVAGGAAAESAEAYDSFEVLDVAGERAFAEGFLIRGRRDHAAVSLSDGRVLIAGGRGGPAQAPVGDAEIVALDEEGAASTAAGTLVYPRAEHALVMLDDGDIALVGGVAANGEPVPEIERFTGEGFEDTGARFPARNGAAYVALIGGRLLQIGGREGAVWTGLVDVLLEDDTVVSLGELIPPLEDPRAVARFDGRVIVAGRDPIDRRGRAVVLDVGGVSAAIEASRAPTAMIALADGSIAQGDGEGMSLLRIDVRTALDPPPGSLFFTIPEDRAAVALDAPDRWRVEGGLVANDEGARFDLRGLALADFTLELDGEGSLALLLTISGSPAIDVLEACATEFVAPLRVVRAGDRATLGECSVEVDGRVGIAVRAARGAIVRSMTLSRD